MSFPKKFFRWKDTSEFSTHCNKWDEWEELNVPGGTTEEDILYWISKGKSYQICEVLSTRIIGYDAPETRANARLIAAAPELLEMLHKTVSVLERVGNDTLDGRNTALDARELLTKIEGK